jgi:hypothetical protein
MRIPILIVALVIACATIYRSADAQTSTPAPPARPLLVIQSTPGGAQVYVDDEVIGTTSQQGRLKVSTLKPGKHTLRLSLSGYRDLQMLITLVAEQSLTKAITLKARNGAANPPEASPTSAGIGTAGASAGGPSSADTLNWIRDTLQNDPGSGVTYSVNAALASPPSNYAHSYDFHYSLPQNDGCQVTLLVKESLSSYSAISGAYPGTASSSSTDTTTYSVNLSELDPTGVAVQAQQTSEATPTGFTASISGDQTYSALELKSTDNKPAIHSTAVVSNYVFVQNGNAQPQPDRTTNLDSASFSLKVRDPNVASRLASAFKHAIEVCGGKPSAF